MSVDLVDRYLQAVRFLLPKNQREDVARELADELQSQVEAKEAELGHSLDENGVAALLKYFGHPALLALRYQEGPCLIGPRVFPLYWFCVKAVIAILTVVHLMLPMLFVVASGESDVTIARIFLRLPGVMVGALGWITLLFVVLDTDVVRTPIEKALAGWNPRDLPALRQEASEVPAREASLPGVIGAAILSAWWLVGLRHPTLLLGPAAAFVAFGPAFHTVYVPMLALAVLGLVLGLLRLLRPGTAWHRLAQLLIEAGNLVVVYVLARSGPWIVSPDGAPAAPMTRELLEVVNGTAQLGLGVALAVTGVVFAWSCVKALRHPSPRHMA
jgi:hypothetical protein